MSERDLPVRIEELLEHSDWVQRLAYRLVGDHATAQDIVQRTWKAGLRTPPRHRSKIKAWLRRVVRNLAFEDHRAATARAARERAVARAEAESLTPQDLVQRAEATELLSATVQELAEPYRTTILRHYYQGLSAREIADAEHIPVETVRTRLKRGIAQLEAMLKERHGPDWEMALLPLLPKPGAGPWMTPVSELPRSGAMSTPTLVAAGILIGAVAVAFLLQFASHRASTPAERPASGASPSLDRAVRPVRSPRSASAPDAVAPSPAPRPVEPTAAVPDAARSPAAHVSVTVQRDADVPSGPIPIVAIPRGVGVQNSHAWSRRFEAEGAVAACELPLESPEHKRIRSWDLRVDRPDLVPTTAFVAIPADGTGAVACRLDARLAGIFAGILDLPGPPAVCAPFASVLSEGEVPGPPLDTSEIGADGSFRLRLLPDRPSRIVIAVRGFRPVVLDTSVPRGTTRNADRVRLDPGGHIAGTVVGPDGIGLARVKVIARSTADGATSLIGVHDVTVDAKDADWTTLQILTDAEGHYRFDGLRPGGYRVAASVPGLTADRSAALTKDLAPDADDLRLVMDGASIVVSVTRAGASLSGAALSVLGPMGVSGARTGPDGRARILGQPGAKYTITCLTEDKSPRQIEATAPDVGGVNALPFELGAKTAAAQVVLTLRGAPGVRRAGIHTFRVSGPDVPEVVLDLDAVAGDAGTSRLRFSLPPGPVRVVVRPGGGWGDPGLHLEQSVVIDPRPGVEVAAEVPLVAAGRLRAGARGRDGKFVGANCTLRAANGQIVHVTCPRDEPGALLQMEDLLSPHGAEILSPALAPGSYVMHAEAPGYVAAERRVEVRAGEIADLVFDLDRQ